MKLLPILMLVLFSLPAIADVAKDIVIDNSFVRSAIQQQRNSAAFMQIKNQGKEVAIVYAKSKVAKIVELHTHINDKGVMRMRKVKKILLPTLKTVHLKPGGLHIMLLGLNRDLKPDDNIDLVLGFDDGSEKTLQVPVQNTMKKMKTSIKKQSLDGSLPKLITH